MSGKSDAADAIRALYEQHRNDIYRYARLTLCDPDAALDVVQDVFLRAFRAWDGFRQEANAKTWLMRIARNAVYDSLRRRQVERRLLADPGTVAIEQLGDRTVPADSAIALDQALWTLQRTYREVFVLRHIEGYSVAETAAVLGWSQSNVKATDRRAIAKLRRALRADEDTRPTRAEAVGHTSTKANDRGGDTNP